MGEHKRKGTHIMKIIAPIYLPDDIKTCHAVIRGLHKDLDGDILSKEQLRREMDAAASQARLREIELQEQIEYWKSKTERKAAPVIIKSVYKD